MKLLSLFLALVLALAAPASAVSAQSQNAPDDDLDYSQLIWNGLWSGVNVDLGASYTTSSTMGQTVSTGTASNGTYAALGDSVAAGVGLPSTAPVPADYTRCGRTAESYPYLVAGRMNMPLAHTACSGATVGDLFTRQRSGSPNLPAQLDTAFTGGKPGLITITAGANDAHWVQFLYSCYNYDCATASTTTLANAYLAALQVKLVAAFTSIKARSGTNPPRTLITGYYNPVSASCSTTYPSVTPQEVNWMTAEVNALNQTIRDVASLYSFVTYVPINFTGHDVCSPASWIQGRNDRQPFHPTAQGQRAMADAVLTALGR
jgi:lysophospholipase L1-like esterase